MALPVVYRRKVGRDLAGKRVVVLSVLHTARDRKLWPRPRKTAGFSYAMVLAAVVIVGIVVEAARVTTWRIVRADREAELLFRGQAYRNAIASFYQSNGAFPRSLEDLPIDPRSASKRHIRALALSRSGESGRKARVEAHPSRGWRYLRRRQRKHGRAAQAGEFSEGVRKVYGCEILFGVGVRIHAGPGFQAAERRRGEDGSTGGLHAKRV